MRCMSVSIGAAARAAPTRAVALRRAGACAAAVFLPWAVGGHAAEIKGDWEKAAWEWVESGTEADVRRVAELLGRTVEGGLLKEALGQPPMQRYKEREDLLRKRDEVLEAILPELSPYARVRVAGMLWRGCSEKGVRLARTLASDPNGEIAHTARGVLGRWKDDCALRVVQKAAKDDPGAFLDALEDAGVDPMTAAWRAKRKYSEHPAKEEDKRFLSSLVKKALESEKPWRKSFGLWSLWYASEGEEERADVIKRAMEMASRGEAGLREEACRALLTATTSSMPGYGTVGYSLHDHGSTWQRALSRSSPSQEKHPEVAAVFRKLLIDPNREVRIAAIKSAGYFNEREAWELLLPLANDPDEKIALQAAGELFSRRSSEVLGDAARLLKGGRHEGVRALAALYVGESLSNEQSPVLAETLARDDSPAVRAAAIKALSLIEDKVALGAVESALEAAHLGVRVAAARALLSMGKPSATAVYYSLEAEGPRMAADMTRPPGPDEVTRRRAADVLLDNPRVPVPGAPSRIVPQVRYMYLEYSKFSASAEGPSLQRLAQELKRGGYKEAAPVLIVLLLDEQPHVRKAAAEALAECADENGLNELMLAATEDPDLGVRGAAAAALARAAGARAPDFAETLIGEKDPLSRAFGVNCLAREDGDEAAERFVKTLESRDAELAGQAIKLVREILDWRDRRGKARAGLKKRSARLAKALAFFLDSKDSVLVVDDRRNERHMSNERMVPLPFPDGRLRAACDVAGDAKKCLEKLGTPEAKAILQPGKAQLPAPEKKPDPSLERLKRVRALAREKEPSAASQIELIGFLDDESGRVKREALSVLPRFSQNRQTMLELLRAVADRWPKIVRLSKDPDARVRAELCDLASTMAWRAEQTGGAKGREVLGPVARAFPELAHLAQDADWRVAEEFWGLVYSVADAVRKLEFAQADGILETIAEATVPRLVEFMLQGKDLPGDYKSPIEVLRAEDVLPELRAALRRADGEAKKRIVKASYSLRGPAGEALVLELTRGGDAPLAEAAAEGLDWTREKSAARAMEILKEGPDRLRRALSTSTLPSIEVVPELARLLDSRDREVRRRAARILASAKLEKVHWRREDSFLRMMREERPVAEDEVRLKKKEAASDDAETRVRALDWWLASHHHVRSQVFKKAVGDPDPRVRVRAACGLAASFGAKAAEELQKLARTDPDDDVRSVALWAFFKARPRRGRFSDAGAPAPFRERVKTLLAGDKSLARRSALLLAASVGGGWEEWIKEEIASLVRSEDGFARETGLTALALAPYPDIVSELYLADEDGPDHEYLVYLVQRMPWLAPRRGSYISSGPRIYTPLTEHEILRKLGRKLLRESVRGKYVKAAGAALDSLQSNPTQTREDLIYVHVEAAAGDDEEAAEAAARRLSPIAEAYLKLDIMMWKKWGHPMDVGPADVRELARALRPALAKYTDDYEPRFYTRDDSFMDRFRQALKNRYHERRSADLTARLKNRSEKVRAKAIEEFRWNPPEGVAAEELAGEIPMLPRGAALALLGCETRKRRSLTPSRFLRAGRKHPDKAVRELALVQMGGYQETVREALELARPLGPRMHELVLRKGGGFAGSAAEMYGYALEAVASGDGPLAEAGWTALASKHSSSPPSSLLRRLPTPEAKTVQPPPEMEKVREEMRSRDPEIRKRAKERQRELSVEYAWRLLASKDPDERRLGAMKLGWGGAGELAKLLGDRDRAIRAYAIVQLASPHEKDVEEALAGLFADPDPTIRWLAAWAYDFRNPEGREEFILSALEKAKGEELIVLSCLLVEPSKRARRESDSGPKAGEKVPAAVADYLRSAFESADPGRRRGAVVACGIARFPEAEALLEALSDEDRLIRSTAAWALGRCALFLQRKEARKVVAELKRALAEERTRRSAEWALKRFGD